MGAGMEGDVYPAHLIPEGVEVGKIGFGVLVGVAVGKIGLSLVGVIGMGWKAVGVGVASWGAETKMISRVGVGGITGAILGVITHPLSRKVTPANTRWGLRRLNFADFISRCWWCGR